MNQLDQYARIGYWTLGMVCHIAIITTCYYAVRAFKAQLGGQ